MKLKIINLTLAFGAMVATSQAVTVASWNFTSTSDQLDDTSGNGNDLTNLGVTFNTTTGADFDGTTNGELRIAYDSALEPGIIAPGEIWTLSLTGVKSDMTDLGITEFGAVYSSRDKKANGTGGSTQTGTIIYRNGETGKWEFWTGQSGRGWNVVKSEVVADPAKTFDLTASWDGTTMTFTVSDGTTSVTETETATDVVFNSGNNVISFGNGADDANNFFFDGQIASATIDVSPVPEPSSAALLGLGGLALILRRRK